MITARRLFAINVVAQCVIVVTGALVRLTGSGLGCPTWPECAEGSLVPTANQLEGVSKFIEFGNRLLTFALMIIVIACIVAALRTRPRRKILVVLSFSCLVGIALQAVIGGITVLTGLSPWAVTVHFLVSIALITVATALYEIAQRPEHALRQWTIRRELVPLSWACVIAALLVVVLGTLVTGSGPHAGDAAAFVRYPFDIRTIAWLHADVVIALCGCVIALVTSLKVLHAPQEQQRAAWGLLLLLLAQGFLGYTQFFTGVPEVLVAIHVAGACATWWLVLRLFVALRTAPEATVSAAANS